MNAYELADWLTEHSFLKDTEIAMMPVINMLRQQADRIAELEKQNEALEQLRPYWAKGFSNDSVAAQCTVSAMSELHKLLGANNQTDAVIKIKQQQKRIAELEKLLEHSVGSDCREMRYIQEIENKDARIAELEKQLKPTGNGIIGYLGDVPIHDMVLRTTPQKKPLSDEEIIEIRQTTKAKSTENWADTLGFARAIEERHGIK